MKLRILISSMMILFVTLALSNTISIGQAHGNSSYQKLLPKNNLQDIITDSVIDFSGVQGQKNWFYGYFISPFDSSTFQTLPDFGTRTGTDSGWIFLNQARWTSIFAEIVHPNGETTTSPAIAEEQWVVRRWISNISGQVDISGTLAKADARGGDGITGQIMVDGSKKWSQFIAGTDSVGVNYKLTVSVIVGSSIDFIVAPNATDFMDSTRFTAEITKSTNSVFLPLVVSSSNTNSNTVLLAPVASGQTIKVAHGYNDPLPSENCVIGASLDHCNNQRYGLDFTPSNQTLLEVLAPISGKIAWISGDCLGIRTSDDYNLTICHFGQFLKAVNDQVSRGTVLGTRRTSWIHLSMDDRYRNSSKPPVPFNNDHAIEGVNFDPPTNENTERNVHLDKILTSSNQRQ